MNCLVMLSVRYASKNGYNAGKTSGVLGSVASGAYRCLCIGPIRGLAVTPAPVLIRGCKKEAFYQGFW